MGEKGPKLGLAGGQRARRLATHRLPALAASGSAAPRNNGPKQASKGVSRRAAGVQRAGVRAQAQAALRLQLLGAVATRPLQRARAQAALHLQAGCSGR